MTKQHIVHKVIVSNTIIILQVFYPLISGNSQHKKPTQHGAKQFDKNKTHSKQHLSSWYKITTQQILNNRDTPE